MGSGAKALVIEPRESATDAASAAASCATARPAAAVRTPTDDCRLEGAGSRAAVDSAPCPYASTASSEAEQKESFEHGGTSSKATWSCSSSAASDVSGEAGSSCRAAASSSCIAGSQATPENPLADADPHAPHRPPQAGAATADGERDRRPGAAAGGGGAESAAPAATNAEALTLYSLSVEHLQQVGGLGGGEGPECRICLAGDHPEALIAACNCIGSMRFAHVSCLETWCEERQSMLCEICGKAYAAPLTARMAAALERGAARHQREQVVQLMEVDGRETAIRYMPCCGASRARVYVAVLLMFVVTLGLLYVVLFVSGDSQPSVWAVMLLRILAFLLPLYLIVQAALAYCRFRHARNARRVRAEARNAA